MTSIWQKVRQKQLCCSLMRLISFVVNWSLLARALKVYVKVYEQVIIRFCLVWNIYFTLSRLRLSALFYKSNSMKMKKPFKHGFLHFLLQVFRLQLSWKGAPPKSGEIQEIFLLVSFLKYIEKVPHGTTSQTLIISSGSHRVLFLFKLFFNHCWRIFLLLLFTISLLLVLICLSK